MEATKAKLKWCESKAEEINVQHQALSLAKESMAEHYTYDLLRNINYDRNFKNISKENYKHFSSRRYRYETLLNNFNSDIEKVCYT